MIKPLSCCYSISSISDIKLEYLEGNRNPLDHMDHIRRIANAMRRHKHIPLIMVAEYKGHKYIVDGQHRYEAAKLLWENGEEYDLCIEEYNSINPFLEAIEFNTTRLDWSIITYLRAFAINNYPNYREFLDWMAERNWNRDKNKNDPYRIGLALLGVRGYDKIKKGVFQLGIPFATATKLYNNLENTDIFDVAITNEASAKALYKIFVTDLEQFISLIENYDSHSIPPSTSKIKDWAEFYESFI
ncbi:MAG: ParB N-terminal domain-containing protein [Methanobrevibacter sp.]|nr:ParB N-terminal domain-containing protein [Methanobrevibacter sp.]